MKRLLAAAALAFFATPAIASSCEKALARHAGAAGLPSSLATALASSLAIGPGGRMAEFAVSYDGQTHVERSARGAARAASSVLARGARQVRVGCLGMEVHAGMNEAEILRALDPEINVAAALGGISGAMAESDIGESLAAISQGAPAPAPSKSGPIDLMALEANLSGTAGAPEPEPNLPPPPVGQANPSASRGSIKATWGLFSNSKPQALTNP